MGHVQKIAKLTCGLLVSFQPFLLYPKESLMPFCPTPPPIKSQQKPSSTTKPTQRTPPILKVFSAPLFIFLFIIIDNGESVKKRKDRGQSIGESLHLGCEERPLQEPKKVQTTR